MKKRALLILAFVVCVVLLTACAASSTQEETQPTSEPVKPAESAGSDVTSVESAGGAKKVAGVVFQEDQFMKLLSLGYQAAAKDNGFEIVTANTNSDLIKESELINTYRTQGVQGIAISPVSEEGSMKTLRNASDSGMLVAMSNQVLANPEDGDFIVVGYTSDNYAMGKATGEKCKAFIEANLNGEAKIAVIQFKTQLAEQSGARYKGFVDVISTLPGVEIVTDQDAWLQDKAVTVVGDILTANPEVNIIWCANDGGTVGATMAVKNANKAGEVFVFGTDSSDQMADMLLDEDNILQAITGQDPYNIGYKTMQDLIDAINGKDYSETKGKVLFFDTLTLSRDDPATINQFKENWKAMVG